MKKSLVLAMAMALGVTASAYAANPFSDVPAGHWAYDSISKLAAAGVIEGYGDDTFRGDRLMTRYEMAQIVAKAMAKGANVDKLAAEFADELDALGVRVAALEKKSDNVKVTGYFRYHYESYKQDGVKGHTSKLRSRIWFTGKVNDNWDYVGMLENNQDLTNNVGDEDTKFQRAYLQGRLGGVKVIAGRWHKVLVDNDVYGDRMDGIDLTYGDKVKFNLYYAKPTGEGLTATDADKKVVFQHDRAWGINAKAGLGKNLDFTVGYDEFRDPSDYSGANGREKLEDGESKIFNVGLKYKAKDFNIGATYLHTNGGPIDDMVQERNTLHKNGLVIAANYKGAQAAKVGSWGLGVKYYNAPAGLPGVGWSTSTALGSLKAEGVGTLNKSLLWEGYKGWYATANVTVAKNMIAGIQYWDLKGRESDVKNKTLWTDLVVTF